ncbi:hypothetical protein DPMN_156828 [Dreissena polymorpha]|uniref:DNA 3'-5' helicase n=1 Tax=Dreissena polymorpha TaxID=45954 RepID=A0A9D4FU86_DREPO|nr:hypothetical protein DPMN_156828 [Dreissena polymorpha]
MINALKAASPVIRLILTSSVAGMGFDPTCVTRIIHAKPPASIAQYLQEIGRAGRRGQQSHAILYYNKRVLAANTPGIQQDIIKYCSDDTRCLREKSSWNLLAFRKVTRLPMTNAAQFASQTLQHHTYFLPWIMSRYNVLLEKTQVEVTLLDSIWAKEPDIFNLMYKFMFHERKIDKEP